jgi:hypothetical protein
MLAADEHERRGARHDAELYILEACQTVEGSAKRTNKTIA